MKKVYVSDDRKEIRGNIKGIKKAVRFQDGILFTFNNDDNAYHAAQVLMNSGYETVRIMETTI